MEEPWDKLKTTLMAATEVACSWSKGHTHINATWWWDKYVEVTVKKKRILLKLYICSKEACNGHYEKLLDVEFDRDEDHLKWNSPIVGPSPKFSKKEVTSALAKMKD